MITYNTDGVKMPKIKKRETTAWIRAVAASYGKKVGEVAQISIPQGVIELELISISV